MAELAGLNLHPQRGSAPDPATAEGLLRAKVISDKLNSLYAFCDDKHVWFTPPFPFDFSFLVHLDAPVDAGTRTSGRLLSKWDKREAAGSDTARDTDMLVESLRADKDGFVRMFICSLYFIL